MRLFKNAAKCIPLTDIN